MRQRDMEDDLYNRILKLTDYFCIDEYDLDRGRAAAVLLEVRDALIRADLEDEIDAELEEYEECEEDSGEDAEYEEQPDDDRDYP